MPHDTLSLCQCFSRVTVTVHCQSGPWDNRFWSCLQLCSPACLPAGCEIQEQLLLSHSQPLRQLVIALQPFIPRLYKSVCWVFSDATLKLTLAMMRRCWEKHSNSGLTLGKVLKCLGQPSNRHQCQPALRPGLKNLQTEETLHTRHIPDKLLFQLLPFSGRCRSPNSR